MANLQSKQQKEIYLCMMKVFLWGYMGSGKSTIGKIVAQKLDVPFFDLDKVFESQYKIEIKSFFSTYGEEAFREIEKMLLRKYAENKEFVISTGGGTACFFDNSSFMNSCGETIYLDYSAEILFERLKLSHKKRPLFSYSNDLESITKLKSHLDGRKIYYESAKFKISPNHENAEQIAQQLCDLLLQS